MGDFFLHFLCLFLILCIGTIIRKNIGKKSIILIIEINFILLIFNNCELVECRYEYNILAWKKYRKKLPRQRILLTKRKVYVEYFTA